MSDREPERHILLIEDAGGAQREVERNVITFEQQRGIVRESERVIIFLSDVPATEAFVTTLD